MKAGALHQCCKHSSTFPITITKDCTYRILPIGILGRLGELVGSELQQARLDVGVSKTGLGALQPAQRLVNRNLVKIFAGTVVFLELALQCKEA